MGKERRVRKQAVWDTDKTGQDISPELREILEEAGEEGVLGAGVDAGLEEGIIVSREEILRLAKPPKRSRRKKKPSE